MNRQRSPSIIAAKISVVLAAIPFLLGGHEYGPDAGYTGVPKEFGTCTAAGCHTETANSSVDPGSVAVSFPNGLTYTPGVKQHLTVTISDPATTQRAWGFQLTARPVSNTTTMAGSFASADANTGVMCANAASPSDQLGAIIPFGQSQSCPANKALAYIEHSLTGYTATRGQTGSASYLFDWTPPSTDVGNIVVYVAGIAANGDLTQNGDHTYTTTYTLADTTATGCAPSVCVSSTADNASSPAPGTLRYAVQNAAAGATITFDPGLNGKAIVLDTSSPNNHVKITQDVTIQGPGAGLLTISGGNLARIFFIAGGTVTISGLTLSDGFAKGGFGGLGGGAGGAGMGGAIFQNSGVLTLNSVMLSGNRAEGGSGAAAGLGGGGGGFGGNGTSAGGSGGDLGGNGGVAGTSTTYTCSAGGDAGPGGGGGGGGSARYGGCSGGAGGFGGGGGGGGSIGFDGGGGSGGAGGFGGGGGGAGFGFFAGPTGGAGGFAGGRGGSSSDGKETSAGGGAGFGGAIFVSNGGLQLFNTSFLNNLTTAGVRGGSDAADGQAKGGALFICTPSFCGAGHNASVILQGNTSFQGNVAADAGRAQTCPGRDDVDVCGAISTQTVHHFSLSAPASTLPATPFTLTVSAVDVNNNLVFTYGGAVHFSSSDPLAGLPPNSTLTNGVGSFTVNLKSPGSQTITATDTVNSSLVGTSNPIAVASTTPTHFSVSAPATATPGTPFNVTVTALDANNAVVAVYAGKVHFSSMDPSAALPGDATLTQGVGTFSVTLSTGPSQKVTVSDSANPGISGTSNAIAVNFSGTLSVVSAAPAFGSGGGTPQPFTFTFSDPNGWRDLSVLNILINNAIDGRHACYLAYVVPTNTLILVDDAGHAEGPYAGSVALGSSIPIQNSQCAVTLVSATGTGANLALNLNIAFKPGFGGNKLSYMAARDVAQNNTGWQALGVWQVPFSYAGSISVDSLGPARGASAAGVSQPFTVGLTDSKGAGDFGVVNLLINSAIDGRQACYLAYAASNNTLYLVDDAGHAEGPYASMVLNGGGSSIQNNQCIVAGTGSSAVLSGNTLTLTLNITFKGAFAGNRILYVAGRDRADGNNTDWQALGTWIVQ